MKRVVVHARHRLNVMVGGKIFTRSRCGFVWPCPDPDTEVTCLQCLRFLREDAEKEARKAYP
jgi:hypothetical protein